MNLNLNLKSSIACENKTNLGGFQVQNVIFLDCPTMIVLDFCARSIAVLNLVCLCFRKVKKRVLFNLSRLVCQSLFFGLDFCHVEFFLTLKGCSNYKYSIRICNKHFWPRFET
jgi:hypothetical protein